MPALAQWEGDYPESLPSNSEENPSGLDNNAGNPSTLDNTNGNPSALDNTGGTPERSGSAELPNFLGVNSVAELVDKVVQFILRYLVPSFAMIMIVIAGFRFVTAQGNEEKLTQAKKNFTYTVIGVAVIYGASIMVGYIRELLGGGGSSVNTAVSQIYATINLIIGIMFALVTVFFFWGIIQYVGAGGEDEKIKTGRRHMIWGIIGMAIMSSAWGIVRIISEYIGN